jgi:hypothetical protein
MKVRTAIDRNYVAEKLRGVVHIRRDQFTGGASTLHALTASVWRRTRSAVHALTADGLTSIAPSCPPLPPYLEHDYTYGRVWWAQTMFRRLQDRNHADIAARVAERLDMKKQVTERMIACDLQGL